jgi:hypothetical protein
MNESNLKKNSVLSFFFLKMTLISKFHILKKNTEYLFDSLGMPFLKHLNFLTILNVKIDTSKKFIFDDFKKLAFDGIYTMSCIEELKG